MSIIKWNDGDWGTVRYLNLPSSDSSTLSVNLSISTWNHPDLSAAESASCRISVHFEVKKGKCTEWRWPWWNVVWDGRQIPSAETTAVIHSTTVDVGEKWTNKSEQPRVNIPWCLLSKLLTQVAFSFSTQACLHPVYASGEPSLTPANDSGDNMPWSCL